MSMVSLTVAPLLKSYDSDFKYWYVGLVPLGIFVILSVILAMPAVKILTWEDPLADMLSSKAKESTKTALL